MASSPRSPVRIRTTSARSVTKIFPSPDPSRSGGSDNGLHNFVRELVGRQDLDLDLGQKIHHIFQAPVELSMSFLPSKSLGLYHGHALYTDLIEGILHLIELEGLMTASIFFILLTSFF